MPTLAKYIFLNRLWVFIRKKTILDWRRLVISNENNHVTAHLQVPCDFLFPLRNQRQGVPTDWEPPTHIRDDLFPNLQTDPQNYPPIAAVQMKNTYVYNPNRWPSGFFEWLVVLLMVADSRIIVPYCLIWVPPPVLRKGNQYAK